MHSLPLRIVICAMLLPITLTYAISLNTTSQDSIIAASKTVAAGLVAYYNGDEPGGSLGQLPYPPYYWWESGAMWGTLVDYWYYTGDTTYNNITTTGLLAQTGPDFDYMPPAQSFDMGNDDQAFWGMSVLSCAELNFPDPPADDPQWLALAQGVWNNQATRWNTETCGGGMPWQVNQFSSGFFYKNSISNGAFFNMAARLGAYTGNQTYIDWAEKVWDWTTTIGLIDVALNYTIWDGASTTGTLNCSEFEHYQWTYNIGIFLLGTGVMWNISDAAGNTTAASIWEDRTQGLLYATATFMTYNAAKTSTYIIYEAECEPTVQCNTDQLSFKAYLARWMAATTKVAPWTYEFVMSRLTPNAEAAAAACTGTDTSGIGTAGEMCGFKWTTGGFDNTTGPGQQMNALEVISGLMIKQAKTPVTSTSGGTSQGNPNAGTGSVTVVPENILTITGKDRGGAWFLTALLVCTTVGSALLTVM